MGRFFIFVAFVIVAAAGAAQEGVDSLERELQEIVVRANRPETRLSGSTLITQVEGSPLAKLGSALDVLAQLPMLAVSDGSVAVTGKGSPEIYIDGRPMRDGEELRQLRSDNIRRVELLMAPGAMYGSDVAAVLRVTTRRNFIAGLSLTERAEVQLRRRVSANDMLSLNWRAGAWDIFADGTVARNNSLVTGTTVNALVYDGEPVTVGSSQRNAYPSVTGSVKAGLNYTQGERSFGAWYRFNPERAHYTNGGTEWLNDESPLDRDITRRINAETHSASAYYDDTFGGAYHLHFDGDWRRAWSAGSVATVYTAGDNPGVSSSETRRSRLAAGKIYLEWPLWRGEMSAGAEGSLTRTTLDYRMLSQEVAGYIPSSLTDARLISAAAFASWSCTFGRLSLTAGLRYEFTDYRFEVDGRRDADVSRRDHRLTPDVALGYAFDGGAQLSLSYRAKTVRPPYSQLTGSLNYVGRHEIEGGNTALRDERMHDLQLLGQWRDFIVQADFTRSLYTYAFVKRLYPAPTLQLLLQPVNIDVTALDVYLVWSRRVRAWTPSLTAGVHKQWLAMGGERYGKPLFSWYFDNMFSLPKGFMLTANISGQSGGDMHTNRFGATWFTMDASLGKSFFDNALQLKLSAMDIFNTANNDWTMRTCGVTVDKRQRYDRRGLTFTLTYRFHPRRSAYKGASAAPAELQRM